MQSVVAIYRYAAVFFAVLCMSATALSEVGRETRARGGFGLAYSPDGRMLAVGGNELDVVIFDVEKKLAIKQLKGLSAPCDKLRFSPDGRLLTGIGQELVVWETNSWTVTKKLTPEEREEARAFSEDQSLVASRSLMKDGKVRIWNAATGSTKHQLSIPGMVLCATFAPDKQVLAVGTMASADGKSNGAVYICDVSSGKIIRTIAIHPQTASALAFSPDGTHLAIGEWKTARLWDLGTNREVREFKGAPGVIEALRFSPDGNELVIASAGEVIRTSGGSHASSHLQAWQLEADAPFFSMRGTLGRGVNIEFSPVSRTIAWRDYDVIHIVDPAKPTEAWRDGFGRDLSRLPW